MYPFSGQRLAQGLGARVVRAGKELSFTRVGIDSRKVERGSVFIALRGKRDGESFFNDALRGGALALVGRRFNKGALAQAAKRGAWCLQVRDGQAALTRLATDQRRLFSGSVVAVTGSVGKTGAKEALTRALSALGPVTATPGNLNNHLGVPLSILGLTPTSRALVLELGMNHPGELSALARLAKPSVGVVLNVGDAHSLYFKDGIAGVARAKEELLQGLSSDGVAVVNGDDPRTAAMGRRFKGKALSFGQSARNALRLRVIEDRGLLGARLQIRWNGQGRTQRGSLRLAQGGVARCTQVAAALSAGMALGLPFKALLAALQGWGQGSALRQELRRTRGWNLVLDCYNASPQSTQAALQQLAASAPQAKRLAVLGDMLELGALTRDAMRAAGRQAKRAGVRYLVALGPNARHTLAGFGGEGVALRREEAPKAAQLLRGLITKGDWVLFKGSRGMAVERVASALSAHGG